MSYPPIPTNIIMASAVVLLAVHTTVAQVLFFPTNAGLRPGDALVTSGHLSAAKGQWTSYIVSNTIFTGTVAPLQISAQTLVATNTSSLPASIGGKRLVKRKLGNKELLQLLLGTNVAGIKGFDLVWATTNSGIIPLSNNAQNFVGARKKGNANIIIRTESQGVGIFGISSLGYIQSKIPAGNLDKHFNISGWAYGAVAISAPSITSVFPKIPVASTNRFNLGVGQVVAFKDTIGQDPSGAVINSLKGSFKFQSTYGFGQLIP